MGHLVNLAPGHVSIPAGHHRGYKAHIYERFRFRPSLKICFLLFLFRRSRDFKDIDQIINLEFLNSCEFHK